MLTVFMLLGMSDVEKHPYFFQFSRSNIALDGIIKDGANIQYFFHSVILAFLPFGQ